MASSSISMRTVLFGIAAGVLALISAFWFFYTVRLLYVTNLLRATRAGGQGAFVGAVAFPLLAFAFGWGAWRCWHSARRA
ncbi:MAG: hypothetical protein JST85_02415 [Acidobacteria bacterium]|nr:hypothetical protein [Acidobacteriota bacterium]